jgi:uncharacterized protein YndB with AHSA1/START domain
MSARIGWKASLLGLAVLGIGLVAPARAEVTDRHADGFTLRMSAPVRAGWGQAFIAVGAVDQWWNADHTYSGDASNLSLRLEVGACFCEQLADGTTFEHGRVVAVDQRREVRLTAPLGPLNGLATSAVLVFGWNNTIGADQILTLTYVVEGEGLGAFAEPVDQVLTDQFTRWTDHAASVRLSPRAPARSVPSPGR